MGIDHVLWIGGPGAGKPADAPFLQRFKAMSLDERCVSREPAEMLVTFHWFRGECFPLVVEDLHRPGRGLRAGGGPAQIRLARPRRTGPAEGLSETGKARCYR